MPENVKPNGQGLSRIIKATHCSFKGLRSAWQQEAAFRQEISLCLVLTPIAIFTSQSVSEFIPLVTCLLLVLIVELLNSAIEATVDRIGLERHKLAGQAKDMGSAAVTLSLVVCLLVWGNHLYSFFS